MPETPAERPTRFRTGGLSPRKPTRFRYAPDATVRQAMAKDLGLISLGDLRLEGEIRPAGRDELVLEAQLVARVAQACVVTLAPVPTEIDERVQRRYVAGLVVPEGDEMEMPADDTQEPMPEVIDLETVAVEALALALPEYPRAPGAELGEAVHAAPGVTPLTDGELKPFSGLAALAERLAGRTDSDPDRES